MKPVIIIFALFLCWSCIGQETFQAEIKNLTAYGELSNHIVRTVTEDNRGFVWIGTEQGLTRFDGKSFKPFTEFENRKLGEIPNIFVEDYLLWCVEANVSGYQILLFNTVSERFISIEEHLKKPLPFSEKEIVGIQTFNCGLYFTLYSEKGFAYYSYIPEIGFQRLTFLSPADEVISLIKEGTYWIAKATQQPYLQEVNAKGQPIKELKVDFFKSITAAVNISIIESSQVDEDGFWFKYATEKDVGIFKINHYHQITFHRKLAYSIFFKTQKIDLDRLNYHPRHDAFLYNDAQKLSLVSSDGQSSYFSDFKKFNIKGSLITSYLTNKNQVFLFNNTGLYLLSFTDNRQLSPFSSKFITDTDVGLRNIVTVNNSVYVNSETRLFQFDKEQIEVSKIFHPNRGLALLKGKSDYLWASQFFNLLRYHTQSQEIDTFKIHGCPWSLYEDKKGNIWYYDYHKLRYLNPSTRTIHHIPNNNFEQYGKLIIYYFYELTDDDLLLCTNLGVFKFNLQSGIKERYWQNGKGIYALPAGEIKYIYYDSKAEEYWLATSNLGLVKWHPQKGVLDSYVFNNNNTNNVHAVYKDRLENFWLSTNHGIVQFNPNSLKFKIYYQEGYNEFNRGSHFQSEDDTIYFGGVNGGIKFNPTDFYAALDSVENPEVVVQEYHQYLGKTNNIENLTAAFIKKREIKVYPNDGYFTLQFGFPNFSQSADVRLLYRVKGDNSDWLETTSHQITIRKLVYGKHILEVKGVASSGQLNKTPLEIPIYVIKPIYLQWWFWVLQICFLTGLIIGIIKWRTREINRRNKELEAEVVKRTAQIETDKQTIAEQAERLLELDKTKSKFFANVSHELRTPITLIQGPIQSVLNSEDLNNRNLSLLSKAKQNTQNLLRLVNEILDLTKMEADKLTLDESKIAFYPYLRRIVSNFQSIADIQNIEFTFEYLLNKSLQIHLDEAKFEKVLNNLLSNAFKFTPQNGQVSVEIMEYQQGILITIKDNGRGIPSDDVPHIFNRFYQSKNNTKAKGGLGIGLALSMEFVRLMNGKMWVRSETEGKHQGSTFFVQIPKKEVIAMLSTEDELEIQEESMVTNLTGLNTNKPHTILLVEDNHDLREYLTFLLSPFYNLITANNGSEALKRLTADGRRLTENHRQIRNEQPSTVNRLPSAVISDVMMPIMDGFELLETVKSNAAWRNIPFIMLTARAELKDKLKALRIGVDDYLIKPFDETELLVRIENLLNNYEERQAFHQQTQENSETETEDLPIITEAEKEWLERLETIIQKEMNDSIFTVDYLAEAMNESRNAFFAKVKQLTGLSPNNYIRAIRLQKAKELLETSDLLVNEVSQKVGFQSTDYFSRLFKKEFGKSPSDYLK